MKKAPKLNDWDLFLLNVRKYKKDDLAKYVADKKFFDKQLAKLNYICEDTKRLIDDVETKIIKDPTVDLQNTEKLINVTKVRQTLSVDHQKTKLLDKQLEEQFIELINIQSTYCVGAKDPI